MSHSQTELAYRLPYRSSFALFAALTALCAVAVSFALAAGSDGVHFDRVSGWLLGTLDARTHNIVHGLRLPRALSAFAVGGMLSLAGVLMQVLLRNPLADPYILGTSGGAACGALTALSLGLGIAATNTAAFAGALLATLVV
ncbi:MAG: iron chelate uptake ABC transporter family permease subunit, partial [Pseudomonadota bacterium]